MWVTNVSDQTLVRIDPATNRAGEPIKLGGAPGGLAVGDGSVWVANASDSTLQRIDPGEQKVDGLGRRSGRIPRPSRSARAPVWVAVCGTENTVVRVEP